MPELFVPPSKSAAPAEIAVPEAVLETVPETLVLLENGSLELEDAEKQGLPQSLTTVETLFFYGRDGNGDPELYQVNGSEGTLAIASEPSDLFPTALSGLFAAAPTTAPWIAAPDESLQPELTSTQAEAQETESLGTELLATGAQDPELASLQADALEPELLEPELLGTGAQSVEADLLEVDALAVLPAEILTNPPVFTLVQGTAGKNFLIGTAADNAVFGFGGDDLILVGAGNNLAFGGAGNDTVIGGPGDDILFGGAGNDVLEGGAGDDHLFGGAGDDILYGGAGANVLVGGAGADIFRLGTPGAYGGALVGATGPDAGPDIVVDFSLAGGDRLDFSLITVQPAFAGVELLPFLSFVQVGANTEVQVTTPLGQTTTEAILLDVEADTITPSSLSFTTPAGLPLLK